MLRCYHQKGHYAIGYSTIQPLYKKDLSNMRVAIEQVYVTSQILRSSLGKLSKMKSYTVIQKNLSEHYFRLSDNQITFHARSGQNETKSYTLTVYYYN